MILLRISFVILCCMAGANSLVWGQAKTQDLIAKYEYGKQLMAAEKYELAAEVFATIAQQETTNSIPQYARYLQANCLYRNGNILQSRLTLKKLMATASDWEQIDEARYLLGITYFEDMLPDSALHVLNQVRSSSMASEINTLKIEKLNSYSADQLQFIYLRFRNDTTVGKLLYQKMERLPIYERDTELFAELWERFSADSTAMDAQEYISIYKDVYNVAVMLPFNLAETNSRQVVRENQLVYDLYQGIQVGKEILADEGIILKLHLFDTRRDSAQTAQILSDSSMLLMDLIIGPLYSNTLPLVAEYSQTYQVPMVNPISSNSVIIADNPNAFLLYPTEETKGEKMAAFTMEYFPNSHAYIIYGNSEQELKMAENYQKYLVDRGATIRLFEPFDYSKKGYSKLIKDLESLSNVTPEDEVMREYNLKPGERTPSHIFAALNDPVSAVSLVSALQTLKAGHVNIVAPSPWLEFSQLTYQQLENSNVFLFYPNPIRTDTTHVQAIKERYMAKMNIPPFQYALSGLETIYTFGKYMHQYGTGFRNAIHQDSLHQGILYDGIHYRGGNDNQHVPVFRFEKGKFKQVYPALRKQEEDETKE